MTRLSVWSRRTADATIEDGDSVVYSEVDFRRWTRRFIYAIAFVVVSVMSMNVLLDPYQIFNLTSLRDSYTPNEIYNKVKYLIEHPERHDSFFLGSSRMGMFKPDVAQSAHPQRSYYNLSVLGVEIDQELAILEAIHAGGVTVRELVIGIDLYPFLVRRGHGDPAHQPHPLMSGKHDLNFGLSYLFLASYKAALSRLLHTLQPEPDIGFDFRGDGRYRLLRYERERAADPEAYLAKHLPKLGQASRPAGPPRWIEAAFQDLEQLRNWCTTHGVQTYWFIHPLHPSVLVNVAEDAVSEFRQRIFAIFGTVPDFSESPGFRDSQDYYDSKHYVPELAARIVGNLFQDRGVAGL